MKIETTNIEGLLIIALNRFKDHRGSLLKPFSTSFFTDTKPNLYFKETWFTFSHKNVIRGMHLQEGDHSTEKIVSVIQGSVVDVILDLRKSSKTYGKYFETELNETKPVSLYIPKGCAHGYKVLQNHTITLYMATDIHYATEDMGIKWDSFGYDWKISDPLISEKDQQLPSFQSYKGYRQ